MCVHKTLYNKTMQERILTQNIANHIDSRIVLCGWVHRIRELGGIAFVLIRDRSGIAQVVCETTSEAYKTLSLECVVSLAGTVCKNDKAPYGAEMHEPEITVLSKPQGDLPLAVHAPIDKVSIDVLLNHRIASLRIPKVRAIFEVQSAILQCFAAYMREKDFTETKTSKLIGSGTEGGTGLFEVQYFDGSVFLAQSPQFYKQAGIASGLERVFEIGHVYRAEKHETNRHINEYVSLDVEMAFVYEVEELIELQRGFLQRLSELLLSNYSAQLSMWDADVPQPEALTKIPLLSYDEGKQIAAQNSGERILDIDPKAERVLCEWAEKQYGVNAAFVAGFPRRKRPFYTMPDGQKTKGFDLLFGGVEISTGGLRIHDYTELCESAKKFGLATQGLEDYLSIFAYGCPPHGGWAIGLERLTQKILGLSSVKLAAMFPRDRNRVRP